MNLGIAALLVACIIGIYINLPVIPVTAVAIYFIVFAFLMIIGPPYLYLIILFAALRGLEDFLFVRWGKTLKWEFKHSGKAYYVILLTLHLLLIWQSPLYGWILSQDSGAPQHYIPE